MGGRALLLTVILLAGGLAGCIGLQPAAVSDLAPPAADARAVTAYLRNVSEPIEGLDVFGALVEQVRVPTPDGILLDTWIVRPPGDGPFPLVLEVTPYYGGGAPVLAAARVHELNAALVALLERGYAVGISSVRGTGNSEGCFTIGGASEAKDTAALVEHLAAEPWSNGRVGLIGVSYPGTTPQDVWVEAPPALKTIVPVSGISDLYKYNFVNGVPINVQGFGFNTYYWAMVGASPVGLSGGAQALDPVAVPGTVRGEACREQVAVQEGGVSSTLDGNKDAYWQERDFLAELAAAGPKERASVFYVHGLQDWNVKPHMMEDWLPALWASGVPVKVWVGQWGHAWPDREDWFEQVLVAWMDQFLKGVDTGILDAPAVQVQDDSGEWRHEAVWPPTDVVTLALHPRDDGTLHPESGKGTASYHDLMGDAPALATEGLSHKVGLHERVVFVSEPFPERTHLSGMPVYEGTVTADGRRASLVLTLAEQKADGTLRAFNYAAISLNHVASLEKGEEDIRGKAQAVRVRFFPQDDVLEAGSRLVLIAAGNTVPGDEPGPSLQPVGDGSVIRLTLDDARLSLPVDTSIVLERPQPEPRD